jgi:hypothetical protein
MKIRCVVAIATICQIAQDVYTERNARGLQFSDLITSKTRIPNFGVMLLVVLLLHYVLDA